MWISRAFRSLSFVYQHPITREAPFAALVRVARWQVGARLLGAPVLWPWIAGTKLLLEPGMTGATGNLYVGLHEFEEMAFVLHALRPGDLFVDVGANVGAYSILASGVSGARSIAIEPGAKVGKWLKKNIAVNRIEHLVEIRNVGAADHPGTLRFADGRDTLSHVLPDGSSQDETSIAADSLDRIIDGRAVTLIKVDVEGYEYSVLKGASAILSSETPIAVIVETNGSSARYAHSDSEVVSLLNDHGFRRHRYHPFERRLTPVEREPLAGNTLMVRKLDLLEQRLRDAPPFEVLGRTI